MLLNAVFAGCGDMDHAHGNLIHSLEKKLCFCSKILGVNDINSIAEIAEQV